MPRFFRQVREGVFDEVDFVVGPRLAESHRDCQRVQDEDRSLVDVGFCGANIASAICYGIDAILCRSAEHGSVR
jgi:hypothetical protein